MAVRVIVMGMIVVSRVAAVVAIFKSCLAVLIGPRGPVALVPSKRLKLLAYCAAAAAEANEFAGLAANFFFAVSTQAAKS